ncbi:S9 family peptidase [Thermomonas flagellata]|uniref:S9 family peptidase n=1 Tax=Thermomonas flagellata TaxID=2888524 RepID=UPI001F04B003|nr:S9 family peptidase [Thermomonas flagellata]
MRPFPLALALLLTCTAAHAGEPITLAQAMADPDWIGPPVERMWWRWDGRAAQYTLKRAGSPVRDTWQVAITGDPPQRLDGAALAEVDAPGAVTARGGQRLAFVRNGDVFVRDLHSGALQALTRGGAPAARLQWSDDGGLVWQAGAAWYRWDGRVVALAAEAKAEDAPDAPPKPDLLRERQLRLLSTLADDRARQEAARAEDAARRRADPTRAPAPIYLGSGVAIVDSALSPDGRWLLVVTVPKDADPGRRGKLPRYLTESGYEESEDVRTRVGRNPPAGQRLWLAEVASGQVRAVSLAALPGIGEDPLADLRRKAGLPPLQGERPVRIAADEDAPAASTLRWTGDSRQVAVMLRAIDNKDRWIATVDLARAALVPRHRLHDPAWINWDFNDFGWLPDNRSLWYLSEEAGYAHLYVLGADGRRRQLTDGRWETSQVALAPDGATFYFVCNPVRPIAYEVCSVPAAGGPLRTLTALGGVEDFVLSPHGRDLLVRHSGPYLPPQLAVLPAAGGPPRELTDTRSADFRARDWIQPQAVQIPSRHGAGTIWGKFYGPARLEPGRRYPLVLFVHGAGYLQNADLRWPDYFREQMFHNLLVQQGFLVLDLDYRASAGYGRDWRTAIYRWMGKPELEDYLDGIAWAAAERQADPDRVGIYGGSYGGFLTFMALFQHPGTFKAGAALRPVSDWTQYNHEYTSNILNTPELDPEAYRRSSPIEYAQGLADPLLIAHGMIDDNVFFRDSVMLTQRLIELRKDGWEIALYPLERHGFVHPDSWYDEFRRIDQLFLRTLRPQTDQASSK